MTRVRFHTCTNQRDVETKACGHYTGFGDWGFWSACSATCTGGVRTRSRYEKCTAQSEVRVPTCIAKACSLRFIRLVLV